MKCQNNLKQMGLATQNFESTFSTLPPRQGMVNVNGTLFANDASPQALILPYIEESNKYAQFNFNYRTWDDFPAPGVPASPNINEPARTQDVAIYLCPSDVSTTQKAANWVSVAGGAEGRLNYLGCLGTTSQMGTSVPWVGIFGGPAPAGRIMKGSRIADILDGTSNTAMYAEVMRSTHPWPAVSGVRDNTTIILDSSVSGGNDHDGRAIPSCATGTPWTSSIKYVGLVYERNLWGTTLYTHTLPPNWNRMMSTGIQKYNCGDTAIVHFHVAASSYHTGGVNVCFADGSVRFIADGINFFAWQAMGTRAGGEVFTEN
jgi:prepilin-type processing-associated H-X9-DG protein